MLWEPQKVLRKMQSRPSKTKADKAGHSLTTVLVNLISNTIEQGQMLRRYLAQTSAFLKTFKSITWMTY